MNDAHLHLVFNHLPIIFPIVGIILLLIGIFTKSEISRRNSYIIFILGSLGTIVAMTTGDNAEESVENLPGVMESLIKTHEEAADLFAGFSYALGGISLLSLLAGFRKYSFNKFFPFIVLIFASITLYYAQDAGNTGGQIRHTEIRPGATNQNNGKDATENESLKTEKGAKDDD